MTDEDDLAGIDFDDLPPIPEFDPRTVPVRWSWLSKFALSAAHARHAANRGNDDAGSLAMKLGTAVHAVAFDQPFAVYTETKQRRGKVWDEWRADTVRRLGPHAPIMSQREHDFAQAMSASLHSDPVAAPLLFGPGVEHETLIEWDRRGRRCRSRTDARKPGAWIADLKTCRTAQPGRFERAAMWSGYPGQLWFYNEADAYLTGRDPLDEMPLYIIAIESTPPYVVVVYNLDPFAREQGRRKVERYWSALTQAEACNAWPGYATTVYTFTADDPDDEMGLAEPLERPGDAA